MKRRGRTHVLREKRLPADYRQGGPRAHCGVALPINGDWMYQDDALRADADLLCPNCRAALVEEVVSRVG